MDFEFATANQIHFGEGKLARVGDLARGLGRHAWVVSGSRTLEREGVVDRLEHLLRETGITSTRWQVVGEPDTVTVDHGTQLAREADCDLVVALGGGSALDAGKAIASLIQNGDSALDYIEVVGRGRVIEKPSLPFIAIPTTAGTGSEVTRNAVLTHRPTETKASLRSRFLLPAIALLDPELTYGVPPTATAATGLDAITQLIEPYTSKREHQLIDALALDALTRAATALPRAYADPDDTLARREMMYASLIGGISLAHAGLGAVHAFAAPLGGSFPISHGHACAALLPHVMAANIDAALELQNGDAVVARYARVARALGVGKMDCDLDEARAGVKWIRHLCNELRVPRLAAQGLKQEQISEVVTRALKTSSMKANPVKLTRQALTSALEKAL